MMKLIEIEHPFSLAVISGKGGVGKSMTSVNTADMLNQMGYKTALIDADIGLSNCATLLNEPVQASVAQWVNGECSLEDLPQNSNGITLVTGADEPGQYNFQHEVLMDALDQVVNYLKIDHDFIIIDTPAGAGEMSLWALDTADLGLLVLVDEPTAISDVYRLCKYIYNIDPGYRFASIVNFAQSEETAESTYTRFNTILNYFLKKQIPYFGYILASDTVREAIQQQHTLVRAEADTSLLEELEFISYNIIGFASNEPKQITSSIH